MKAKTRAFTILELMTVVCVLGALTGVAVPAFAGARHRAQESACAKNQAIFDQAKQLWMLDHGKTFDQPVLFKDLLPEYIEEPPICPAGGDYSLNGLDTETSCSIHGTK
jgi:type II secretory pathway pseudopilin PulG